MRGEVRVMAMRHASFYAPLIGTVAGGFLEAQGLKGHYQVKPAGRNPFEMLRSGEVDVMQSAVSSSWARIERGVDGLPRHFGRINRRDGFWLLARSAESFDWHDLENHVVLADHGPQPLAMLRYAARRQGADPERIHWENVGEPPDIVAAWREGRGDFAHLQGPAPHQLASAGVGRIVTAVGTAMPPTAFSSIAAQPSYLDTEDAACFMRAYKQSLDWVLTSGPETIARGLAPFFDTVELAALTASIAGYQSLGCWDASPAIPPVEYETALDVFEWNGLITRRHAYEAVVSNPWSDFDI